MRDITADKIDPFFFACGRWRLRAIELRGGVQQLWLTDNNDHVATFHGETFEIMKQTAYAVVIGLLKAPV